MKTSYSRVWGMWDFHTCIYKISTYRSYGDDITETYIINQILGINHPQQSTRITPTSASSNEGVAEWRRRNKRMGRYMSIQMYGP